jgi:hypothetical protein
MKRLAITLALTCAFAGLAYGESRTDGYWWKSLSQQAKESYVVGWLDGESRMSVTIRDDVPVACRKAAGTAADTVRVKNNATINQATKSSN